MQVQIRQREQFCSSQTLTRKLASIGVSKVVIITPETLSISTVISSPAEDLHKAARPKTRPLITSNHVCNIANRVAIRDVIGEDMFEKGIDQALRQELQGFEKLLVFGNLQPPCIGASSCRKGYVYLVISNCCQNYIAHSLCFRIIWLWGFDSLVQPKSKLFPISSAFCLHKSSATGPSHSTFINIY